MLIARALAQEAPLIVMNELMPSLDFGKQARVLAEVAAIVCDAPRGGQGVIMPAHDPDRAFALDARGLLMKDGDIFRRGSTDEALTVAALSRVYGLSITVEHTTSGRRVCPPFLAPQSVPTMTSDALITAQASEPLARPSSDTAAFVIIAVMIAPPPTSMRTVLLTAPVSMPATLPFSRLRALSFISSLLRHLHVLMRCLARPH